MWSQEEDSNVPIRVCDNGGVLAGAKKKGD